jgi:hypothetical protein
LLLLSERHGGGFTGAIAMTSGDLFTPQIKQALADAEKITG